MVKKTDYLAATKRIYGKTRPAIHVAMGEEAHKAMRGGAGRRTIPPTELSRIIVKANDIAATRLRKKPRQQILRRRR